MINLTFFHFIFDLITHHIKVPSDKKTPETNEFLNYTEIKIEDQEKCGLFLINHGANVNGTNTNTRHFTPLHMVIRIGYDRFAEHLIKAGADINAVRGSKEWTPLHSAYMYMTNGKRSLTHSFCGRSIKTCAFSAYYGIVLLYLATLNLSPFRQTFFLTLHFIYILN